MAKKKPTEIARLCPNLEIVKDGDRVFRVAINADENRILNYVLAAQVREFLESTLAKYRQAEDKTASPKELKDLVDAAKGLCELSGTIYKDQDPIPSSEKATEIVAVNPEDFSKLNSNENTRLQESSPADSGGKVDGGG